MEAKKINKRKKYILIGTTVGTLGLLGFGYWYFKGRKGVNVNEHDDVFKKLSEKKNAVDVKEPSEEAAPEPRHASGHTPKKKAIEHPDHTEATSKAKLSAKTAIDITKNIWLNNTLKKLDGMVTQLKRIRNISDYNLVNKLLKTIRTGGVHQTIVNAALSPFSDDETSKHLITDQFERIGLKYDGEKWNLSGIERKQLITARETSIHSLEGIELEVPAQTLLGEKLSEYGANTKFRTIDGQVLLVPTRHISYV